MDFQATRDAAASGQPTSGKDATAGGRGSGSFASGSTKAGRGKAPGGRKAGGRKERAASSQAGKMSDLDYAKTWFKKFAGFHGVEQFERWRLTQDQVIAFLRNEKSGGAPTWKRLRMVAVDMTAIGNTLRQHAEKSVRSSGASSRASGTVRRLMRRLG